MPSSRQSWLSFEPLVKQKNDCLNWKLINSASPLETWSIWWKLINRHYLFLLRNSLKSRVHLVYEGKLHRSGTLQVLSFSLSLLFLLESCFKKTLFFVLSYHSRVIKVVNQTRPEYVCVRVCMCLHKARYWEKRHRWFIEFLIIRAGLGYLVIKVYWQMNINEETTEKFLLSSFSSSHYLIVYKIVLS